MVDLNEGTKLLEGASPGPWKAGRADMVSYEIDGGPAFKNIYGSRIETHHHVTGDPLPETVARAEGENCIADAQAIEWAINSTPALIAELRAARSTIEAQREEIASLHGDLDCLRTKDTCP